MFPIILMGVWLAAAPELEQLPAEVQPSSTPHEIAQLESGEKDQDLEARIADLEREVQRLRRQNPEEESAGAEPTVAPTPSAGSVSPNVFNPTLTVIGNGLYRYDDRAVLVEETRIDKTFNLREVELDMRAAVDPFADGVAIIAMPSEVPGEFALEVEEGYVNIKRLPLPLLDEPPLGLKLKVGRFRTEVGRINRLHLHDLPQVSRPLVSDEFFGEDGYIGSGLSAQFFIPTPFDDESAVELTAQALTGGGVAIAGGPPGSAAFVGNLRWFRTFAAAHNIDLSFIFHFGRTDPEGELNAETGSGDFLYKWKPLRRGEFRSFVLGGQLLTSQRDFLEEVDTDGDGEPDASEERETSPLGYFAFAQYQLARTTYLGIRWDETELITDTAVKRRAIAGYFTWYASEFLRPRFGYQRLNSDLDEEDRRSSVFAELNFIFGAHPPEPFWVTK
jgi:hypothetical protein